MEESLAVVEVEASSIIIPTKVADGMDGWKCNMVKEATAEIQTNSIIMGKCIVSTSQSLHRLKSLIPKSNWVAFLDSGMIPIKRATALNLVKAWDIFLSKGMLSDGELANISAQSLGKIARANEPDVIRKVTAKLKAGERVTEAAVDKMLNTAKSAAEDLDETNAGSTVATLMDIVETTIDNNKNHKIQEEAMSAKIGNLEVKLLNEKKTVTDLRSEVKELKAELSSFKKAAVTV
jgi:hypothetical protein